MVVGLGRYVLFSFFFLLDVGRVFGTPIFHTRSLTFTSNFTLSLLTQDESDVNIYDEVTDDQYKSVVNGRLQKDDFVVDDGVDGYMDNGMDDFGEGDREEEMSEDEEVGKKRKGTFFLLCPF